MRLILVAVATMLVGNACSPTAEKTGRSTTDAPTREAQSSAATELGGSVRPAAPEPASRSSDGTAHTRTMPQALRGQWRVADLGRDPTREDCNQTSQSNSNFGKVLNVNAKGYSLFEEGGRIIDVHSQTANSIDATFDTTYADTPTRVRTNFTVEENGSLSVNEHDRNGQVDAIRYLRCLKN